VTPKQSLKLALGYVSDRREAQDQKWGSQRGHHAELWLPILVEEVGEVAKAMLEHDHNAYISELVDVAAVAVAALEAELARG
jgi:NTP pyrophosphatase (non-canonical NTP hydrolase)